MTISSSLPLIEGEYEHFSYMLLLPVDMQLYILKFIDERALLNLCSINFKMYNLCINPYFAVIKKWDLEKFLVFRLKLVAECKYKECHSLKNKLDNELYQSSSFHRGCSVVRGNSKIYSNIKGKFGSSIIDIVLEPTTISFYKCFNNPIDLRYFVNLKRIYFKATSQVFFLPKPPK